MLNKIIILLLIFIPTLSISQGDLFSNKTVSSILIVGNNNTKDEVIKRELLLDIGDTFNDSLRVLSEKRIYNLFLFNHVEIIPVPDNKDVGLLINVTERLFLFPFPELRIEDRDWDRITYGFGLAHVNFRGRNEKLYGLVLFGNRPGYQFEYNNPWLGSREKRYTNSIIIQRFESPTRLQGFSFDETRFITSWSVGRYWNRYFFNTIGLRFESIKVPAAYKQFTPSSTVKDEFFGISLSTVYDNRDLSAYPTSGWYTVFSIFKDGIFDDHVDYFQYGFDLRKYHTFGGITFVGRLYTLQTIGDLPFFKNVYFGYGERIRGHFSDIFEGKHAFSSNIEMRFPIIPRFLIDLPSIFLPESSTQNLSFGLNGALFYDGGLVWKRAREFSLSNENYLHGFGAGLHFLLPYVELARLEIGFNENLQSEFIFEVGASL